MWELTWARTSNEWWYNIWWVVSGEWCIDVLVVLPLLSLLLCGEICVCQKFFPFSLFSQTAYSLEIGLKKRKSWFPTTKPSGLLVGNGLKLNFLIEMVLIPTLIGLNIWGLLRLTRLSHFQRVSRFGPKRLTLWKWLNLSGLSCLKF